MVLTQRHSHAHAAGLQQAVAHIQPSRIFGIAGAITLNAAALMLLLVPVSAPMPAAPAEDTTVYELVEKVVPPPPIPIEAIRPTPTRSTTQTPITPPTQQTQTNQEVIVPDGTDYTPPMKAEPITDIEIGRAHV